MTVFVSNTIFDSNRLDAYASCVEIPTVVTVVVRYAAVEYVACAYGELSREAVCVLTRSVSVVERFAVENEVVCGPEGLRISRVALRADINTAVAVCIRLYVVERAIAARYHNAGDTVGRHQIRRSTSNRLPQADLLF